jgi:hypothetical protein
LSRLVQCGCCGGGCSTSRGHQRKVQRSGRIVVYHQAAYRCTRKSAENNHDRKQIKRCPNSAISTHILEGKVFEMIREVMLDPARLRRCIDSGEGVDDERTAWELARIAGQIKVIDDERRRIIDLYAAEKMAGDEYITANRTLDKDLERLIRAKADLAAALRSSQHEHFVDASIRQFCASAGARFQASTDFDTKRQFLVGHIERVIYDRYKVTITGSVPMQSTSGKRSCNFGSRARSTSWLCA